MTINGVEVEIKEGMTPSDVYQAFRDAGEVARVNVFAVADPPVKNPLDKDNLDRQGYDETLQINWRLWRRNTALKKLRLHGAIMM